MRTDVWSKDTQDSSQVRTRVEEWNCMACESDERCGMHVAGVAQMMLADMERLGRRCP